MIAAHQNSIEICQYLLSHEDIDIDAKDIQILKYL